MLLGRITRNIDNSSKQKSFVSYHITQPIEFILVNKEFKKRQDSEIADNMRRLQLCLVILSLTLLTFINAQIDMELCPDGPSAPILDPKWRIVPSRFEIITELVSDTEAMELSQAFSTQRDAVVTSSKYGYYSCFVILS
jgi:hypothetical protein